MDAFRHLSRVTTRVCELGLLGGFLWFEIQVATGLFYLEVPEYLGCPDGGVVPNLVLVNS